MTDRGSSEHVPSPALRFRGSFEDFQHVKRLVAAIEAGGTDAASADAELAQLLRELLDERMRRFTEDQIRASLDGLRRPENG